jgi:toxin FitB
VIILDTNVLSEILRPTPADSVGRWMQAQPSTGLFTTTICEAEIFYGLALMPAGRRRTRLELAVAAIFEEDFAERILPFDSTAARAFAAIAAQRRGLGRPHQSVRYPNRGDYPFARGHSRNAEYCGFRRLRDKGRQSVRRIGYTSEPPPHLDRCRVAHFQFRR